MKLNVQALKVATAVAIPTAIAAGYIYELRMQLKGKTWRAKYMEEKLNSVLEMLTPEQLDLIDQEVSADIEFFEMSKTTLKDVL